MSTPDPALRDAANRLRDTGKARSIVADVYDRAEKHRAAMTASGATGRDDPAFWKDLRSVVDRHAASDLSLAARLIRDTLEGAAERHPAEKDQGAG